MAKFTKATRARLEAALRNAQRAQRFLRSERIEVCSVDTHATTTLHYSNPHQPGRTLYPINKEYGSDLAGLDTAIHDLKTLLTLEARV